MFPDNNDPNRLITLAIHTYGHALSIKKTLEEAGIEVVLHNVNLSQPLVSTGVRVRIHEKDLPEALKIVEAPQTNIHPVLDKDKIIIPIDFSDYSIKACKVGFEYARRCAGTAVLLHAYMNDSHRFFLPFASDRFESKELDDATVKATAKLRLKEFEKHVTRLIDEGKLENVPFVTQLREGIPEECILQCAGDVGAKFIVMGTHGVHNKQKASMGSVTAEVIDAGKFPVFTVPENMELESISKVERVLFFSNLITQDILSFDSFTRLIPVSNLEISIVPVVDKKDEIYVSKSTEQLLNYCKEHYPECNFKVKRMRFDDGLVDLEKFIIDEQIDIIAIPNKKKNIFSRLFNPSIAHRLLFQSDVPMLVVPI